MTFTMCITAGGCLCVIALHGVLLAMDVTAVQRPKSYYGLRCVYGTILAYGLGVFFGLVFWLAVGK